MVSEFPSHLLCSDSRSEFDSATGVNVQHFIALELFTIAVEYQYGCFDLISSELNGIIGSGERKPSQSMAGEYIFLNFRFAPA